MIMNYCELREELAKMTYKDTIRLPVLKEIIVCFPDLVTREQDDLCERVLDKFIKEKVLSWNPMFFVDCLAAARQRIDDRGEDAKDWDSIFKEAEQVYYEYD